MNSAGFRTSLYAVSVFRSVRYFYFYTLCIWRRFSFRFQCCSAHFFSLCMCRCRRGARSRFTWLAMSDIFNARQCKTEHENYVCVCLREGNVSRMPNRTHSQQSECSCTHSRSQTIFYYNLAKILNLSFLWRVQAFMNGGRLRFATAENKSRMKQKSFLFLD